MIENEFLNVNILKFYKFVYRSNFRESLKNSDCAHPSIFEKARVHGFFFSKFPLEKKNPFHSWDDIMDGTEWDSNTAQWVKWLWNRRIEYWAIRSFARTAHSFSCYAHSFAHSLTNSGAHGKEVCDSWKGFILYFPGMRKQSARPAASLFLDGIATIATIK